MTDGRDRLRLVPAEDSSSRLAELDDEPPEINLRVLQPLFRYLRKAYGQQVLSDVAEESGLPLAMMRRSAPWISYARFERVLAAARRRFVSDEEFSRACAYELRSAGGAALLVLRCITVRAAYEVMVRTAHMATRVSKFETLASRRTSVRLRYTSRYKESRLSCLSRQAQLQVGPALWWGRPPATLTEHACIARGDDHCDYHLSWREPARWRRPVALALVLGLAGALVPATGAAPAFAIVALAALGAAMGVVLELRRVQAEHLKFADETSHELERVIQSHANAVDEVLSLNERERNASERLRAMTHDINNPLTVLMTLASHLRAARSLQPGETARTLNALEEAVHRIHSVATQMVSFARDEGVAPEFSNEVVRIDELAERIRGQLRASVMGRDIRVTVFQTREAPRSIETVSVLLDRIVDNLLTNACKYTERGSIVVEVAGTGDALLLKISDTGRGIGEERLERVFLDGQPDPNPVVGMSHGLGLGIVVQLLDLLGGRLEIMSDPGHGTTVWVYIPTDQTDAPSASDSNRTTVAMLERVVKIRPRPK